MIESKNNTLPRKNKILLLENLKLHSTYLSAYAALFDYQMKYLCWISYALFA